MDNQLEKPLVTVTIPAYKRKYLKQALQSVVEQTYNNLEIIIVNDKSPEDIKSVVDEFSDSRIQYYENAENVGGKDPVANWNVCLSKAHGEFFSLLCDDDMYDKRFIETLVGLSRKYPECDVFRSGLKIINDKNATIDIYPLSPELETVTNYIWHVAKLYRYQTISEWMIRVEPARKCNGYYPIPLAWGSDFVSIYRFAGFSNMIVSAYDYLTYYRRDGDSISMKVDKTTFPKLSSYWIQYEVTNEILDSLKDSNIDIIKKENLLYIKYKLRDQLIRGRWKDLMKALFVMKKYHLTADVLLKAFFVKASRIIL